MFDVTILTQKEYVNPKKGDWYTDQVLLEDQMLINELKKLDLKVNRINWDSNFDWTMTKTVVVRAIWDYFNRFEEFFEWFNTAKTQTQFINHHNLITWNIDKKYLKELELKGINIPATLVINKSSNFSLIHYMKLLGGNEFVLKPTISGAARHTYRVNYFNLNEIAPIFKKLIANENLMLQTFQQNIVDFGELSLICFNGKYSHAVKKTAKTGEFRVQDDFGGRVEEHIPKATEIAFAEKVMSACPLLPAFGRVDLFYDNNNQIALGEVEVIEPELWLRMNKQSAKKMAESIVHSF